MGFVFQHYAVFKHMTVAKNVAFGLEIRKRPKDEVAHRVDELLRLVHLQQFSHRLPSQLSGGQRQRMALARALAVEPKVLLLDEPFGALDAKVRKELREWLRRLHDEVHVTTVFVTHDQEEALEVSDEIVVINEGRVEQIGSPDDLYDNPANDFVMGFLGEVTHVNGQPVRPARRRHLDHAGPGREPPRAPSAGSSASASRSASASSPTPARRSPCSSPSRTPTRSGSRTARPSGSAPPRARSPRCRRSAERHRFVCGLPGFLAQRRRRIGVLGLSSWSTGA